MRLISFDPIRTLTFPAHQTLKPSQMLSHKNEINEADWILFPEYWQLGALTFAMKSRIFPSYVTYSLGHNKIEMTRAFEALVPENTPFTLITANTPANADEVWDKMPLPFVAKIPKSSMGEGVFLIESRHDWREYLSKSDVIYAQEFLPIDRDLRIVWIGDKIIGGYWRLQSPDGFHNNIARGGEMMPGPMPVAAIQLVTKVAQGLGINHAGFDIAMVDNYPFILEFNRMFGNQGINSLVGDTTEVLLDYLQRTLDSEKPPTKPKSSVGSKTSNKRRLKKTA
jgi:ribosomal protein S6--L-glutamate ligase